MGRKRKSAPRPSYKHVVDNIINMLQKEEEDMGEQVHSYNEWLQVLSGELKERYIDDKG